MSGSSAVNNENDQYDENGFAEDGSYQPAAVADDGYYEISNAGQLYWFARLVNGYYNSEDDYAVGQNGANARLTKDITVNEAVNESARKWMPICSESLHYIGTFDGNDHYISGLYFPGSEKYNVKFPDDGNDHHGSAAAVVWEENGKISHDGGPEVFGNQADVFVGLFGFVGEKGVVENLTVKNSSFLRGSMDVGVIAGTNNGTIENCKSESNTVLGNNSAGGIAGSNSTWTDDKSNHAIIKDCINSSHVTALSQGGGIAGENYIGGTIENCKNISTIDGNTRIGGITGVASGNITGCTNSGVITSNSHYAAGISATLGSKAKLRDCKNIGNISALGLGAGGIVGEIEDTASIEFASNSGIVTARTYSGGIVGLMSYYGTGASINNCFNTGAVTTPTDRYYAGGIVGQNGDSKSDNNGGIIKNSWNSGKVTAPGKYSDYAGGIYCNLYGAGTVENCYYLDSSAKKAGINGTVTEPDGMTAAQSADAFASGKITWYLNKGNDSENVWYQNVDNDKTHDEYPVLDNGSAVVYACGIKDTEPPVRYTNKADEDRDTHSMSNTYAYDAKQHWKICDFCGAAGNEKENHKFGEWKTVRAASASVPGIQQRACTDCGFIEQQSIYADKTEDKLPEGSGDVTKSVEVKANAPETTLNTSKFDLAAGVLTDEEKTSVTNGDNAHIWLEVTALDNNNVPADDKTATEAQAKQLAGDNVDITYLDISLFKRMSGSEKEQLHNTEAPISITITVPEEIRTAATGMDRTFYVLRSHTENGTTTCTTISGIYDSATGAFTFETDRFSTYALVYKDTKISSSHHSSSSTATYPVTVKSADHGTVTADKANAAKGAAVTLTVKPENGYALDKLTVTDGDGRSVAVTSKGEGKYSFVMPGSGVNVAASFADAEWNAAYRECPKDATCPIHPFTDAKTTDWYHDGMHFCLENGLIIGYGNNILSPDTNTSRAMVTAMLWRLSGSPVVNYAIKFSDVKGDAWYAEAVRWAASEGIVDGYDNGTFCPDDTITREQMAAVLWRYAKLKGYDVSVGEDTNILSYADVSSVAQYAIPAMQWACGSGMISGKTAGNGTILDPKGSTTRAQMSTMMMRFCAEIVK